MTVVGLILAIASGLFNQQVEVLVERPVVQTVEIKKTVIQTVQVEAPYDVQKTVEVEVPVTVVVERLVEVPVPVTVEVERVIEKPVIQTVEVEKEVIQTVIVEVEVTRQISAPTQQPAAALNAILLPTSPNAISAGGEHTCELRDSGDVVCWGLNENGQAKPPTGEKFMAVSAGVYHTCALRPDGTPICWGSNEYGQSSPQSDEFLTTISTGLNHSCGLRQNGTAVCWGDDKFGQSTPIALRNGRYTAISAGTNYTCALSDAGEVICWHHNSATYPLEGEYKEISVGMDNSVCGVNINNRPLCVYLSGTGWTRFRSTPTDLVVNSIDSGLNHVCAIKSDGIPICWGANSFWSNISGQSDVAP